MYYYVHTICVQCLDGVFSQKKTINIAEECILVNMQVHILESLLHVLQCMHLFCNACTFSHIFVGVQRNMEGTPGSELNVHVHVSVIYLHVWSHTLIRLDFMFVFFVDRLLACAYQVFISDPSRAKTPPDATGLWAGRWWSATNGFVADTRNKKVFVQNMNAPRRSCKRAQIVFCDDRQFWRRRRKRFQIETRPNQAWNT